MGAFGRGTVGNEIGFEASFWTGKSWFLLVAIYQQPPWILHRSYFLSWGWHKEIAVCSSSLPGLSFYPFSIQVLYSIGYISFYQHNCWYPFSISINFWLWILKAFGRTLWSNCYLQVLKFKSHKEATHFPIICFVTFRY